MEENPAAVLQALVQTLAQESNGMYWKVTPEASIPVLTARQGLLTNFIGQSSDSGFPACATKEVYIRRLKDAAAVNNLFDTPEGRAQLQAAYDEAEAAFQSNYTTAFGKSYAGTMVDYLTIFGGGVGIDWVPYLELFGPDNCPPETPQLDAVLAQLLPPDTGGRRKLLAPADSDVCEVSPPAPGCSDGPTYDPMLCLWLYHPRVVCQQLWVRWTRLPCAATRSAP